jgi:molybdate transport system permease protein
VTVFAVALGLAAAAVVLFLPVPVLAIFADSGPGRLLDALGEPAARQALELSLQTTATAMALIVLVGTPAAYFLATRRFRGRDAVVTLVELPLVLPPAVAGIALLASVGPSGILGGALERAGVELALQTAG